MRYLFLDLWLFIVKQLMLNYVNKRVKNPKVKKPKKHKIMYLIIIVIIMTITFFLYGNATKERRVYMSLRQDMEAIQLEFNKIDANWEYEEGCKGKGGDFDKNVPSTCFISISNKSFDSSRNIDTSVASYKSLIDTKDYFTNVSRTDSSTAYSQFTTDYGRSDKIKCSFQYIGADESNDGITLMTLGCMGYAQNFYFSRSDT